jgi:Uma2 family endonuclease
MQAAQNIAIKTPVTRKQRVQESLVKEVIDGIPFYYRGYKLVLSGKKTLDEIMGWSLLQGKIIQYFIYHVLNKLNFNNYDVYPGELGAHLGYKNNLSLDISVFDTAVLTPDKVKDKYADVAPLLVIEVDVKVQWDDENLQTMQDFISLKTGKLFEFGVQKLIWVLSRSKKVIAAEPGKRWQIIDWDEEIELIEGIQFNIGAFLKSKGINPDIV